MQPPMSFSELDATPFGVSLKFSIAYGESFAQLLVKKKLVRSGQITKL